MTVHGIILGTILIDGFVGGTWRIERTRGSAVLAVAPFAWLSRADRAALESDAGLLLWATDPDVTHAVTFACGLSATLPRTRTRTRTPDGATTRRLRSLIHRNHGNECLRYRPPVL
jgi:hypothetical protein